MKDLSVDPLSPGLRNPSETAQHSSISPSLNWRLLARSRMGLFTIPLQGYGQHPR